MLEDLISIEKQMQQCLARSDFQGAGRVLEQARRTLDGEPRVALLGFQYYQAQGRWSECLASLEDCFDAGIDGPRLRLARAGVLERLLRPEEALAELRRTPEDPEGWHTSIYVLALEQLHDYEGVVRHCVRDGRLDVPSTAFGSATLKACARALEKLGDHPRAFEAARLGNELMRSLSPWDPDNTVCLARLSALNELLDAGLPAGVDAGTDPVDERPDPVFLIGFPRSGTTLLEQALDAHPGVEALEEPPTVERMIDCCIDELLELEPGLARPDIGRDPAFWKRAYRFILDADTGLRRRARDRYFAQAASLGHDPAGARLLLDKMPLNSMYLPLLAGLFPRSRFIIALRHPCDSILSGWMRNLDLNDAMCHFLSLRAAATLYDQTLRVLDRSARLPQLEHRCHWVRYERLVADFRGETGAAIDFIGLPWDASVLNYAAHARGRGTLRTPSAAAVTGRISSAAVNRWSRYRAQMRDVLPLLEPACSMLGYELAESVGEPVR